MNVLAELILPDQRDKIINETIANLGCYATNIVIMYEDLKNKVLNKLGVASILPRQCKLIAKDILETTHKHVSETTLKRFFGLAAKNYKFSSYTLSALDAYAEHGCQVSITTKINSPTAESGKDKNQFHLLDSTIQSANCEDSQEFHKLDQTIIPVKIKLNPIQVQELKKNISKAQARKKS